MEIKVNKEIRDYSESMYFGLSLRQFICSVGAVGVAVLVYFVGKNYLSNETISWVCVLVAAPFAAVGFVKYNGMTAEKFVWVWFKHEFLVPKKLIFRSQNLYYELLQNPAPPVKETKKGNKRVAFSNCKKK